MSKETQAWANENFLVGQVLKYGKAWHFDPDFTGESNHYPEMIPVADIERRLFSWDAVSTKAYYDVNGKRYEMPGAVWARSDTGAHLGTFSDGYQGHQYREWLLEKVQGLLDVADEGWGASSAVLLQGGAVAAVQVEAPEGVTIGGDLVRPFIVACTSFNGKYVTSYKRGTGRVVCDNTLEEFHNTADAAFKVKHTKHSKAKLSDVREVLEISFKHQAAEIEEIERLMNMAVTDDQFSKIVAIVDPINTDEGRGITRTSNRHLQYHTLWNHDQRVGPYKNTAWGTLQVFNTYGQHMSTVRASTIRPEVNILNFLGGKTGKADSEVRNAIKIVVGV